MNMHLFGQVSCRRCREGVKSFSPQKRKDTKWSMKEERIQRRVEEKRNRETASVKVGNSAMSVPAADDPARSISLEHQIMSENASEKRINSQKADQLSAALRAVRWLSLGRSPAIKTVG